MAQPTNPEETGTGVQHDDAEATITLIQEATGEAEQISSGILEQHAHFLTGDIEYGNITRAIQWIVFEHASAKHRPKKLTLYINSGGGDLYNAFALIDIMRASSIPIHTVGIGSVVSAAALIFSCGEVGHRYLAKHTGVMLHQFSSDMEGKEHELTASMKELKLCRARIRGLLKTHCGISDTIIQEKLLQPSDAWLTSSEAIKYKLADKILKKIK